MPSDPETKDLIKALNDSLAGLQYKTRRKDQFFAGSIGAIALIMLTMIKFSYTAVAEESVQQEQIRHHTAEMATIRKEQDTIKETVSDNRNTLTRVVTLLEGQKEKSTEIIGLIRRFHMQGGDHGL